MKAKTREYRESFLCCLLSPFTVLLTTEMTLLGKGKYFPSSVSQGMCGISQPSFCIGPTLAPQCAGGGGRRQPCKGEGEAVSSPPSCSRRAQT